MNKIGDKMNYDTKEVIYKIETELGINVDELGKNAYKKLHTIIREHETAIEDELTVKMLNIIKEFNPRIKDCDCK